MQKFWVSVALKALSFVTSTEMIENATVIVKSFIDKDMAGEEKRRAAFRSLRAMGYAFSSWMLNAAIELALGYLKLKQPNLFERERYVRG